MPAAESRTTASPAQSVWNDRLEVTKSWITLRAATPKTQSHMVKGAGHGEEYTICWVGRARRDDRCGGRGGTRSGSFAGDNSESAGGGATVAWEGGQAGRPASLLRSRSDR